MTTSENRNIEMQFEHGWVDLAAGRVGGRALIANDEFFAPKENLLKPGRGQFIEDKYTDYGKWMDGWETRRRRGPGHDWCIIRLGLPGRLHGVTVDTHHFKGNHPESFSLDACSIAISESARLDPSEMDLEHLAAASDLWTEIVPRSPLEPDHENYFEIEAGDRFTLVRLNIFPDGGVARLRVWGEVEPDWLALEESGEWLDLVAIEHGGRPLAASDEFFSRPINLILPGRAIHMGDGWETRRRRVPGHDWAVFRLGRRGVIERIGIDTLHFKGNFPQSCSLEGCDMGEASSDMKTLLQQDWRWLLPKTPLRAHREHWFIDEIVDRSPVTHIRFNIYPDGGVSRLRLLGRPREAE